MHDCFVRLEDREGVTERLRAALAVDGYGTTLLKGVTGSGKTEVYLAVAEQMIRQDLVVEQCLVGEIIHRVETRHRRGGGRRAGGPRPPPPPRRTDACSRAWGGWRRGKRASPPSWLFI